MPSLSLDVVKVIGIILLIILISACIALAVGSVSDLSAAAQESRSAITEPAEYVYGHDTSGFSPMSLMWSAIDSVTGWGIGGPDLASGGSVVSGVLKAVFGGAAALMLAVVGVRAAISLWS